MLRVLLILLFSVIAITLIKAVVGAFSKAVSGSATPQTRASAPPPQSLKKDPVCGTFVAATSAWQKTRGGETFYFCSADCRDKFANL